MALIDMIQRQLDDNTVSQLSQQLGADPETTRQAVPAALTALLGGLSHNAQQPGGAQSLASALGDHEGSLLDNLGGALGNPAAAQADGGGILGHIFGSHQPAVASQIGQRTGLNQGQAIRLLMLLAPFVLSYLSRQHRQQQQQQPGSAGGGITDILNGERASVEQAHPEHSGILSSILGEVAGMAGGLLRGGR
jgi:hypothetical protein